MQAIKSLLFLIPFFFVACSTQTIEVVKTQEVYIPIKCNVEIPKKPAFKENIKQAKELLSYYVEVERLLIICTQEQ